MGKVLLLRFCGCDNGHSTMGNLPMSKYTFERVERFSDQYPVPALLIHAEGDCGRAIRNVAAILEPDCSNPCLLLNGPLGINGVQAILAQLKELHL